MIGVVSNSFGNLIRKRYLFTICHLKLIDFIHFNNYCMLMMHVNEGKIRNFPSLREN